MKKIVCLFFIALFMFVSCPVPVDDETTDRIDSSLAYMGSYLDFYEKSTNWTVMCYMDGDNNLESYLLDDVYEMSQGLNSPELINVIVLFDRIDGESSDSSILGGNFTDTRLYRVGSDEIYALQGEEYFDDVGMTQVGEYNMGDVDTLESFIDYCKNYYPADNYALILSNHGSGVKSYSSDLDSDSKGDLSYDAAVDRSICYDDTSGDDSMYTAELTDVLDSSHSVDLLVYDACLMGLVEIAYEYRPEDQVSSDEFSVDYIVASPPNVWGYGFPYDRVFSRISTVTADTGDDSTVTGVTTDMYEYAPEDLTAELLGRIFVEEQKISTSGSNDQCLALYDLSFVDDVVDALDEIGMDLESESESDLDDVRGDILEYTPAYPLSAPHYDLYDFALDTDGNYLSSSESTLQAAVDNMVAASFGDAFEYSGFMEGSSGLGFFFTDGNASYGSTTYWNYQWYYTGADVESWWAYGNLDFCHADDDGVVDGWFELLQSYYNPYDPQSADYDNYHPGRW